MWLIWKEISKIQYESQKFEIKNELFIITIIKIIFILINYNKLIFNDE